MSEKFNKRDFLKLAGLAGSALGLWSLHELGKTIGLIQEPIQKKVAITPESPWFENEALSVQLTEIPSNEGFQVNIEKEKRESIMFGGVDFLNSQVPISMHMTGNSYEEVSSLDFYSYLNTKENFDKGLFDYHNPNAGVWRDNDLKRTLLWIHSGRRTELDKVGYTAWKFQEFIERENGSRRSTFQVEKVLRDVVRGSSLTFNQNDKSGFGKIAAAVRVPPNQLLIDSEFHAGDLPEWVSENFKDTGFEVFSGKKDELLIIKFCGTSLAGEDPNDFIEEVKAKKPFERARFVLGIIPA